MTSTEFEIWTMYETDTDRAVARVKNNPRLQKHLDILIEYDWDNYDDHMAWIADEKTTTDDIVEWCGYTRYSQEQ